MLLLPLQVTADQCIDCVEHGAKGNWGEAVACVITLAVTAIIRHFEKKRIERNNKKEL